MRQTSYATLDPRSIVIQRETRQRQENIKDVEDLVQSIKTIGVINPLVVRREGGATVLVAGERRLTACLSLQLDEVPVRYFEDLSQEEGEIIELEENVKRKELSWRDQVRAVGRIHLLYKKNNAGWKIEQTADAVSLHHTHLRKILHVFDAIDSERLKAAESIEQAYNTLHRFSERKAESIVGDIITRGASIFGQAATAVGDAVSSAIDSLTSTSAVKVASSEGIPVEEWGLEDRPIAGATSNDASNQLSGNPANAGVSQPPAYVPPAEPIICVNFIEWVRQYNGPKFSLIHCDFPYGNYRGGDSKGSMANADADEFYDNHEGVYWQLVEALTTNLDRVMSYSAHMIFWFNMNFYSETVSRFRKVGLMVHDHPLIWHKTGGPGGLGVVPGTAVTYPRRTYDTALLMVRGGRPLAKPGMNSYAAPTVGNKIHPSQKPEPMLRHFLSMVVDETTTVLDPTCGSAAALRAAEDLGAKSILGIEMDANYAQAALQRTLQARILRQAGTTIMRQEDIL
jgi:ParB/RepB/Spo0J family partition protein